MSVQVENLENNMAKLTIEVAADEVTKAIEKVYNKEKGRITIPGFRKGKAPRKIIEKMYGKEVFYEGAINDLIPSAYAKAADETDIEIVSQPKIDVTQFEEGKDFIFTAEVAVKPEVELGQYKGIEVTKVDVTVTEDEINAEIDKERAQNARTIDVTDRPVEMGDKTIIDFEGFVDGEPFEGGKGLDYPLEIGSHSFIDNFEDQLVGKNIGEEVEVNVTFPEEYHADNLAGKPAMFKVTVKKISTKELPELNDEFV
ncbi:MAG: trigger factor, partial [Lachnospiraceae bacterium]|nr:trigger factor [Lachnospiraceae bacterium]